MLLGSIRDFGDPDHAVSPGPMVQKTETPPPPPPKATATIPAGKKSGKASAKQV